MYVCLILTCKKYYESRYLQQLATIKEIININRYDDVKFMYIIGNPYQEEEFIYDDEKLLLSARIEDTYEKLPIKVFTGLKYIYEKYNPIGIIKFDDDIVINDFNYIINYIKSNSSDYSGVTGKLYTDRPPKIKKKLCTLGCNHERDDSGFAFGWIYYLSNKSIKILLDNYDLCNSHCVEDYLVGKILLSNNIKWESMFDIVKYNAVTSYQIENCIKIQSVLKGREKVMELIKNKFHNLKIIMQKDK